MPAAQSFCNARLSITGGRRRMHREEIAQIIAKIRSRSAAQMVSKGQDWAKLFRRLDKDRDGTLDQAEVKGMFRRVLKITKEDISDQQIQVLFEEIDSDHSGELSLEELKWLLGDAHIDEIVNHIEKKWNAKGATSTKGSEGLPLQHEGGPTQYEIESARELFQLFDEDYSGTIDSEEMVNCLQGLGFNPSRADCASLMASMPARGADFDTFVKLAWDQKEVLHHEDDQAALLQAFQLFDTDGRGWLSIAEIRHIMQSYGEPLSEDELTDMVERLDDDGDGIITFEEAVSGRLFANDPLAELHARGAPTTTAAAR